MSIKTIYDQLRAVGMTAEGACGLMGNMQAESAMRSNNVEDRSGMDDDRYTALADSGSYDFLTDYGKHYGFGLAQWTLASRKENLLNMAKKRGVSVSDEAMQVDFAIWELSNQFPGVWTVLTTSHDLYECTRIVCLQYERPAVNNVSARYAFAVNFFEQQAGGSDPDPAPPAPQPSPSPQPAQAVKVTGDVILLQTAMALDGFWELDKIDGLNTAAWREAFRSYAKIVAGR
jgi:hypothetical protein